MKIVLHREFKKSFTQLPDRLQTKTLEVIQLFAANPHESALKNHALSGRMQGLRSLSVSGDCRIIYESRASYILVILLAIGTHEQVYR